MMYRLMLFRALTGALAVHSVNTPPALASIARSAPRNGAALAAAACALPFVERAVLGLVAVEEFTPGEAAAVLRMPSGLVERCLESALDRLSPIPGAWLTGRASLG
jgi:DNA-directed RNA polymerase specialized sigma24 family protein